MPPPGVADPQDVPAQSSFRERYQAVLARIHDARTLDDLKLHVGADIAALFDAERVTIYSVGGDQETLVSKLPDGSNSVRDVKIPISERSIVGHAALARKTINIGNVNDDQHADDQTRQLLVVPINYGRDKRLVGLLQLTNNNARVPFGAWVEQGVAELAETLAIALEQGGQLLSFNRYDFLGVDGVLLPREFERARDLCHEKKRHLEQVLIEEFGVTIAAIGEALAKFFGAPYEPFRPGRTAPMQLVKTLKLGYVDDNWWLPIEGTESNVVALCVDPERTRTRGVVPELFPNATVCYKVTTHKEFWATVDQFYGGVVLETKDGIAEVPRVGEAREDQSEILQRTANLWISTLAALKREGFDLEDALTVLRWRARDLTPEDNRGRT